MTENEIKKKIYRYKFISIFSVVLMTILVIDWDVNRTNELLLNGEKNSHSHGYLISYVGFLITLVIHIFCQLIERLFTSFMAQIKQE